MYEELIKALRGCVLSKPCELCPFYDPNGPSEKCATMNFAAADAIEELSKRIDFLMNCIYEAEDALDRAWNRRGDDERNTEG